MGLSAGALPAQSQHSTLIREDTHSTLQERQSSTVSRDHEVPGGTGGSLTWVSDDTRERDNFRRMRSNIGYIAPKSPFVPADMNEWLVHRVETLEDNTGKMSRTITLRRREKASLCATDIQPALGGRRFGDFRSAVLAQTTIWRPDEAENPSRLQAPWPDSSERKHEGYQRVRSGYSRFPPLPRVPGNPTVNWKQRSPITAYDFDRVGQPVVPQDTATEHDWGMESLIGWSLLLEIDA
ncbi:conserved hypothetical protein [Talaromyces stipitatus ATCC 10500]|uniref:Uncharacterized protein n=1 Tax=Talaromyces stipitatus (strain ATCC 10500 / CBS 375.48 / QM 6759 / NRRL 1006) TaxID=441959 RepID=B8LWQ2_TALSN|nr:uncharacterized protein TSTA_078120 [Talaromyces stipitatus ATCC 10500]EED24449.1 conserved hypothetical protein [Talaromyces stipitatus ATCC 10500]